VLVDGNRLPTLDVLAEAIVKGDARCRPSRRRPSWPRCTVTAGAVTLHLQYPNTVLRATKAMARRHMAALRAHGACPLHRQSFAPVAQVLK
jgi:ribonuclease HII